MATAAVGFSTDELIIDAPGSASVRVPLERDRYRLGRSSANELAFPADQRLSRDHLVFERTGKGWNVRDNGSRNGTQVNGKRLTQTTPLVHGDRITAGNLSIRYEMPREFADARVDGITFFEQSLANPTPAVSVTLKSALQVATDPASNPTLENAHLGALVRAGRELAGHGALEKFFELVLDLSLSAVKATRGVVMTREGAADLKTRAIRGEGLRISATVRDLVMNEGRSLLVRDAQLDQDFGSRSSITLQKIRSILAVPLQTDERVIGLLYLDSPHRPTLRVLAAIALQVTQHLATAAVVVAPVSFDDAVRAIVSQAVVTTILGTVPGVNAITLSAAFSPDAFILPLDSLARLRSDERKLSLVPCLRLGVLFDRGLLRVCEEAFAKSNLEPQETLAVFRHAVSVVNEIAELGPNSPGIGRVTRFGDLHAAMIQRVTGGRVRDGQALKDKIGLGISQFAFGFPKQC